MKWFHSSALVWLVPYYVASLFFLNIPFNIADALLPRLSHLNLKVTKAEIKKKEQEGSLRDITGRPLTLKLPLNVHLQA